MKRTLIIVLAVCMLSSCGTTSSLYFWGRSDGETSLYEKLAYDSYKKQTPEKLCQLVCAYEVMVTKPGGIRNVPPPGICAEYGYLLLKPETAETFQNNAKPAQMSLFEGSDFSVVFRKRGEEMLMKEMEYYPESRTFIEPLVKRITQ